MKLYTYHTSLGWKLQTAITKPVYIKYENTTDICIEFPLNGTEKYFILKSLSLQATTSNFLNTDTTLTLKFYDSNHNEISTYTYNCQDLKLSTITPKNIFPDDPGDDSTVPIIPTVPIVNTNTIYLTIESNVTGIKLTELPTYTCNTTHESQNIIYIYNSDNALIKKIPYNDFQENDLPGLPTETGKIFLWVDIYSNKAVDSASIKEIKKDYHIQQRYYLVPFNVECEIFNELTGEKIMTMILHQNALLERFTYNFTPPEIANYTFSKWGQPVNNIIFKSYSQPYKAYYKPIAAQEKENNILTIKLKTSQTATETQSIVFNSAIGEIIYLPANFNGKRVQYWYSEEANTYYTPYLPYDFNNFVNEEETLISTLFNDNFNKWPILQLIDEQTWQPIDPTGDIFYNKEV